MIPVIGVPLRYEYSKEEKPILYMSEWVRRTLQQAGAYVFSIIPVQDVNYIETKGNEFDPLTEEEKKVINKNLDLCDGLFIPGGIKFTPYDRYLLEIAIEKHIPILGVCLGMQLMSCYDEDVHMEKNSEDVNHNQKEYDKLTHKVIIDKDSRLYQILGIEELEVNSFHNFHVTKNHIYKTVAHSSDGLIEAIEFPSDTFNIGVQWHPEISYSFDENSKKIIDYFIREASEYKLNKTSNDKISIPLDF